MRERNNLYIQMHTNGLEKDSEIISISIIIESVGGDLELYHFSKDFLENEPISEFVENVVNANTRKMLILDTEMRATELALYESQPPSKLPHKQIYYVANDEELRTMILEVLNGFNKIYPTEDCKFNAIMDVPEYGWVKLMDLLYGGKGGALANDLIYYIPEDIAALFKVVKGDSDYSRFDYVKSDLVLKNRDRYCGLSGVLLIYLSYKKLNKRIEDTVIDKNIFKTVMKWLKYRSDK